MRIFLRLTRYVHLWALWKKKKGRKKTKKPPCSHISKADKLCFLEMAPVFELRKNKWMSHKQPSYNNWLSVQVFGCPNWNKVLVLILCSNLSV